MQHVDATHSNPLQYTSTDCNTLQHTAPYYNTLQHTATYCNKQHVPRDSSSTLSRGCFAATLCPISRHLSVAVLVSACPLMPMTAAAVQSSVVNWWEARRSRNPALKTRTFTPQYARIHTYTKIHTHEYTHTSTRTHTHIYTHTHR